MSDNDELIKNIYNFLSIHHYRLFFINSPLSLTISLFSSVLKCTKCLLFADDTKFYITVNYIHDCLELQLISIQLNYGLGHGNFV